MLQYFIITFVCFHKHPSLSPQHTHVIGWCNHVPVFAEKRSVASRCGWRWKDSNTLGSSFSTGPLFVCVSVCVCIIACVHDSHTHALINLYSVHVHCVVLYTKQYCIVMHGHGTHVCIHVHACISDVVCVLYWKQGFLGHVVLYGTISSDHSMMSFCCFFPFSLTFCSVHMHAYM